MRTKAVNWKELREPNDEFSGALVADGTREVGKRVRWNEQLGRTPRRNAFGIMKIVHSQEIAILAPQAPHRQFLHDGIFSESLDSLNHTT